MPTPAPTPINVLCSLITEATRKEQLSTSLFLKKDPIKSLLIQEIKAEVNNLTPEEKTSQIIDTVDDDSSEEKSTFEEKAEDKPILEVSLVSRKRKHDEEEPIPLTTTKKPRLNEVINPVHTLLNIVNRFSYESLNSNDKSLLTKFLSKFPIYIFHIKENLLEKLQQSLFCRINHELFSEEIKGSHPFYLEENALSKIKNDLNSESKNDDRQALQDVPQNNPDIRSLYAAQRNTGNVLA
jgi:hypothetical protein